jgi:hypothetical protein
MGLHVWRNIAQGRRGWRGAGETASNVVRPIRAKANQWLDTMPRVSLARRAIPINILIPFHILHHVLPFEAIQFIATANQPGLEHYSALPRRRQAGPPPGPDNGRSGLPSLLHVHPCLAFTSHPAASIDQSNSPPAENASTALCRGPDISFLPKSARPFLQRDCRTEWI